MDSNSVDLSGGVLPPANESAPAWQGRDFASTLMANLEGSALAAAGLDVSQKRYGFHLGTLAFLIKPDTRSEAVPAPVIAILPHSPRWLLGLLNLRGNLVPVFDLKHLCAVEQKHGESRGSVLVLDIGEKAVAFPIDALPTSVSNLKKQDYLPPVPDILVESLGECYVTGFDVWIEFDHEAFFSSLQHKMAATVSTDHHATSVVS